MVKFMVLLSLFAFDSAMAQVSGSVGLQQRADDVRNDRDDSTAVELDVSAAYQLHSCATVSARATTGDGYRDNLGETSLTNDEERSISPVVKNFSVKTSCGIDKVADMLFGDVLGIDSGVSASVEAGALEVSNGGSLGLSQAGWMDGVRVVVQEEGSGRTWIVESGNISEIGTADAFSRALIDERDFERNHTQVQFMQEGMNLPFDLEGALLVTAKNLSDKGDAEIRAALEVGVAEVIKIMDVSLIDTASYEILVDEGEKIGDRIGASRALMGWNLNVGRTSVEEAINLDQRDYTLGAGNNYTVEATRQIRGFDTTLRGRFGDDTNLWTLQLSKPVGSILDAIRK